MLKRPFKSVIARIAIVALALSLVFPFIPAALAQSESTSVSYAENGMAAVATFTATDDEGDAVAWGLEGDDAGDFEISSGGVLTFKESPDFESPADANEDNTYSIDVTATGTTKSTHAVTVTVTDEDEDGKVNLSQPQPQVSRGVTASLVEEDAGVEDESWQWARSSDKETWADIAGATTDSRTPTSDDQGMYLRATVTYADKFGAGKTASGVSENPVEARTVSNAAPSFADHDTDEDATNGVQATRAVDEGKKGANVGKAVSAKDADNDVLLYSLNETALVDHDGDGGTTAEVAVGTILTIDSRTGQIKTKVELNSDDNGVATDSVTFEVTVTAMDPSGAPGTATVTITVNDVNDSPAFAEAAPKELWVTENATGSPLRTGAAADATVLDAAAYVATDADAGDINTGTADPTATPPTALLTYAVGGADKDSFEISDAGVLTVKADHEPDFEKQSSYSITIMAMDDERATAELEVTVTVTNDEDDGVVTLTQRGPQVGRSVLASLSDEDGGIRGASWQWYRNATSTTAETDFATAPPACAADTAATTLCAIPDANSPSYTPVAADMPADDADTAARLAARVTYTDGHVTDDDTNDVDDGDNALVITQADVQRSDPANTAPAFPEDNDPNTAGNQPDAMRSVAENEDKGTNVGDPVTAEDADSGDLLIYSLSGPDAAAFTIGSGLKGSATTTDTPGQIETAEKLDYEAKSMYTVVVTATDPSGASDTINVIINVTDVNDKPVVELNVAPQFAADSADREVAENSEAGANVGDPVAATDGNAGDTLSYALSGDGADAFAIDGDGQITVAEGADLDFEAETNSYTVTVTATDAAGESDSITVNISVTNVNETPAVTGPEGGAVNYAENGTDPVGTFTASDPDDGDSVTWSLSGADAGSFEISEDGVLSFVAPAPEEEEPAETNGEETNGDDTNGDDANGDDTNGDDTNGDDTNGDDTNGDDTNGDDTNGDDTNGDDTNGDDTNGDDTNGDDTNGDDTNGEEGNGEEMMAFSPDFEMPGDADGDNVYEVTVTATDAGGESASVDVTVTVTDVDEAPVNTAPAFATESVTLSVDENSAAGANVGDPVVATDANEGDEISYTLADESGSFEIWPSGQITVAEGANLDFETQSTYTVTVTASDGTDSSSVEVTINIGNVGLASPYDADDNGAITKAEAVNAVQDYFDDEVSREAVLEVIRTYFG